MKIAISIIIAAFIVGGSIFFLRKSSPVVSQVPINNVAMEDGKQIITLSAKGGYTPRSSVAKAGIPTILRINTSGTFDCSSSVRIPSMNITKVLPNTGSTDIDLGSPQIGTLQGTCGMGMYPFDIQFNG